MLTVVIISFAPGSKEVFALEADYIDEDLNDFLKALIDEYAGIPWAMDTPVRLVPISSSIP